MARQYYKNPGLTPMEYEIAMMKAEGFHASEIAERHRVVEQTVKNHLGSIYKKLGIRTSFTPEEGQKIRVLGELREKLKDRLLDRGKYSPSKEAEPIDWHDISYSRLNLNQGGITI